MHITSSFHWHEHRSKPSFFFVTGIIIFRVFSILIFDWPFVVRILFRHIVLLCKSRDRFTFFIILYQEENFFFSLPHLVFLISSFSPNLWFRILYPTISTRIDIFTPRRIPHSPDSLLQTNLDHVSFVSQGREKRITQRSYVQQPHKIASCQLTLQDPYNLHVIRRSWRSARTLRCDAITQAKLLPIKTTYRHTYYIDGSTITAINHTYYIVGHIPQFDCQPTALQFTHSIVSSNATIPGLAYAMSMQHDCLVLNSTQLTK